MTVSSEVSRVGPFSGNGSTTVFDLTFLFSQDDDLEVTLTNATGTESILSKGTHYSVSGAGTATGTVTMVTAPASGEKLTIRRKPVVTQPDDLTNQTDYVPNNHEARWDAQVMQTQRVKEESDRALKIPVSDTGIDLTLPTSTVRASKIMAFDSLGNPSTVAVDSLSIATLQAFTDWKIDAFTAGSNQTVYNLSADPGQKTNTTITIDGVTQELANYSLAGQAITLSTAPATGSKVEIRYGKAAGTYVPVNNSIPMEALLTSDLDTDLSSVSGADDTLASAKAIKTYVDAQVDTVDTLAEVLANGNGTGGTDIAVGANDDITLVDGSNIILGTSGDGFALYHNGSNSYITETGTGTGNLFVLATDLTLGDKGNQHHYAHFVSGGEAKLFYDNDLRYETTNGGGKVTGDLQVTGGDIELGSSNDTTISRASAGVVTIEGQTVRTGTVGIADGGTGATTSAAAASALGVGTEDSPTFAGLTTTGNASIDGAVTINDGGADEDFRVESSGNANMLFVDGGANKVGIGIGTPLYTATVAGADGATNMMLQSTAGLYRLGFYNDSSQQRLSTYNSTAMTFAITESEKMRLDNGGRFLVNKSSTQTANAPLQVASTLGTGQIFVGNGSGTGYMLGRDNVTTGNFLLGELANDSDTSVTNLLTIATGTGNATFAGNVTATGTIEPAGDTAAGDNAAIGYTAAEGLILTGQGLTSDITLKNDADQTVFTVPTGTTNIQFGDASDANTTSGRAVFGEDGDASVRHNGSNFYLYNGTGNTLAYSDTFQFFSTTGSEVFARLNHNAAVELFYDNVKKLETTSSGVNISANEIKVGDNAAAGGSYDSVLHLLGDSSSGFKIGVNSGNTLLTIDREQGGWQNNQLVMRRDTGAVGINVAAPAEKLSVGGNITATGNITSTGNQLKVGDNNAAGGSYDSVLWLLGDGSSGFRLSTNAANSAFNIEYELGGWQNGLTMSRYSGNVGIGCSDPGAELEIAGDYQPLIVNSTNSAGAKIVLEDNGVARGYLGATSTQPVTFYNSSATLIGCFDSNGNFEVKPTQSTQTIAVEASGGGARIEMQVDGGTLATVGSTNNVPTAIQANSSEVARFGTDGRVIIGDTTTATGARLGVTGSDYAAGSLNYVMAIRNSDAYSTTPAAGILFQNKYNSGGSYADAGGIEVVKENATDGEYGFGLGLHTRANGAAVSEKLHITGTGNVGLGRTPAYLLDLNGGGSTADQIVRVADGSPTQYLGVYNSNTGANAPNSANATLTVRGMDSTVRSINAGGTVNASGNDYAEYMTKAAGCGTIAKGAICGVDADGKLTDQFDAAHSYVVKSTDPSYVGGDIWGIDSTDADGNQTMLEGDDLEAARQRVDRIAFAGQVPCLVTGSATVGDYIVPQKADDGGIEAVAVSSPSFDQYRSAVGKIWKLNGDNKHIISVKIG